jgi:hypothetical protein
LRNVTPPCAARHRRRSLPVTAAPPTSRRRPTSRPPPHLLVMPASPASPTPPPDRLRARGPAAEMVAAAGCLGAGRTSGRCGGGLASAESEWAVGGEGVSRGGVGWQWYRHGEGVFALSISHAPTRLSPNLPPIAHAHAHARFSTALCPQTLPRLQPATADFAHARPAAAPWGPGLAVGPRPTRSLRHALGPRRRGLRPARWWWWWWRQRRRRRIDGGGGRGGGGRRRRGRTCVGARAALFRAGGEGGLA